MVFLGDLVRLMTAQVCFCVWTIATLCWLAPFQGVLHTAACTVLDLKPHDRMTPAVQELHWLPVAERIQFKLCLLEHKSLFEHVRVYIGLADISCQCASVICTACLVIWQPRRPTDTSKNQRQGFFCRRTMSMEQAANTAEAAAAIDHYSAAWRSG